MSAAQTFVRAVGIRLLHSTARGNLAGLFRHGLLSPHALAGLGGHDPADLILRRERRVLSLPNGCHAQLNHQRPILDGLTAANTVIDGHDARSWAAQLDRRIFLWPEKRGRNFLNSIARDTDTALLWLDSASLFNAMADALWLSPINSGNFRQGGAKARRGDWLYCRTSDGLEMFRSNRQKRRLVKSRDRVNELSITEHLPPSILRQVILEITTPEGQCLKPPERYQDP